MNAAKDRVDVIGALADAILDAEEKGAHERADSLMRLANVFRPGLDGYDWTCFASGRGYSACGGRCLSCRLRRLLQPEKEA